MWFRAGAAQLMWSHRSPSCTGVLYWSILDILELVQSCPPRWAWDSRWRGWESWFVQAYKEKAEGRFCCCLHLPKGRVMGKMELVSPWRCTVKERAMDNCWKGNSGLILGEIFYHQSDQTVKQVAQRGCGFLETFKTWLDMTTFNMI